MSEYVSITQFVNSCVNEINEREAERLADRLNELGYVKVVRCRDCEHAEPEGEPPRKGCEGLLWCDYLTEGIGFSVLPHNFCAWGKRKEGGE